MSTTPLINVPALIGGFTAIGIVAIGAAFIPRLLKARAEYQQQRRSASTARSHPNRRPPIPSRQNVPHLSLQDVELDVIHITRSQMGSEHQSGKPEVVDQRIKEEAVWEVGKAV